MTKDDIWKELWQTPKPLRPQRLLEICQTQNVDTKTTNELIDWAWTHTEFPSEDKYTWTELWPMYNVSQKQSLLIKRLFKEPRVIYRGGHRQGLSWTLDKDVAVWFATHRNFGRPVEVHERLTSIDDVRVVYNVMRNEKEVVLDSQYWLYDEPI